MKRIFLFIESFSTDYCCILCYATREEMDKFEKGTDFESRTCLEYEGDLSMLDSLPADRNHYRGIKSPCVLNELENNHITDYWLIFDSMHTVTEGIGPCGAGSALYSISKLDPLVTVERVNLEFSYLFDSLIVERHNKPHQLTDLINPGNGFAPKQNAAQNLAIIRHLPHILKSLI